MRNKKKIFAILVFFVLLGGGVIVYLAGQGNKPSKIKPVGTELPQTEPAQEVLLTTKPSITGVQGITKPAELLPTVTMLPVPTTVSTVINTPVPMMASTVTNTPVPTIIPIVSNTPIITNIPTITDTPLPTITNATIYTPTPIIPEGTTPEYTFQMGDDVWFKYYENSDILVVAGTGATWDFKDFSERWKILKKYDPGYDYAEKIFIEEGIVRIGNYSLGGLRNAKQVVLPDTLQEIGTYAFAFTGANNEETEWINLNLSELKTECNSFTDASGIAELEGGALVMATPTPIPPTPTPSPIPKGDPNNPKPVFSTSMGENIIFEFWDNGYLYVKGTGATMNRGDNFTWASWEEKIGVTTIARGYLPEEFLNTMTHLVVEEGVTELGDWVFNGMDFYDIELPKSLKKISENCREVVDASKENVRIHGYLNGKEFTVNAFGAEPNVLEYNYFYNIGFLFDYITDEERIKEYQMTVLWH